MTNPDIDEGTADSQTEGTSTEADSNERTANWNTSRKWPTFGSFGTQDIDHDDTSDFHSDLGGVYLSSRADAPHDLLESEVYHAPPRVVPDSTPRLNSRTTGSRPQRRGPIYPLTYTSKSGSKMAPGGKVPQPGPARIAKGGGPDEWLEAAKQCKYLPEAHMKQLCETVKEFLMEG